MRDVLKLHWLDAVIGCLALAAALLVTVPGLLNLAETSGSARIIAVNAIYLEQAANEGLQDTLLLGELAALLEVIKSTDFGVELVVSVDVGVGEVLSGLTRAIEWAAIAAASATITAHALQYANAIADQLSALLLVALLWAITGWMLLRILPVTRTLRLAGRSITETIAVLFLLSYLVLPYAINITGWLGQTLAGSLEVTTQSSVEQFHKDTLQGGSLNTDLGYWTDSGNIRAIYEEVTSDLHDKVSAMTRYAVERFAHLIIVGLLFPLSVIVILTLVLRRLTALALDSIEQGAATKDP